MAAIETTETKKDRIDLRLFNTIIIYDEYVVARDAQLAREALEQMIISGDVKPTENTSTEIRRENYIRQSRRDAGPLVAADVTDAEFEAIRGNSTAALFERFYTKR